MDKISWQNPKNLILAAFMASKPSPLNLLKLGFVTFLTLWYETSWKKKRKNWWSRDLAFQANGKRNEAKLIRHSCEGGWPTYFSSQRWYRLSVAVWWYFLVRLWVRLVVLQGLIQAFLACLMGINDLLLLLKNISLEQRQQRWESLPT